MLKGLLYNVKTVGKTAYMADEDNNVFVLKMGNNPYKYNIVLAKNNDKNLVEEVLIENPTQEQKEYALLNLIVTDISKNNNKTGIYHLDLEQIIDEFVGMFHDIDYNKMTVADVFHLFGIAPKGEYSEITYNSIIKDVIKGRCENVDENRLVYAMSSRKKVPLNFYKKDSNGFINLAKPNTFNYGYRIIEVRPRMEIENKKPTQEQLENALLNVIIEDNQANPNKSGAYNIEIEELTKVFSKIMNKIESGECNKKMFMKTFGLDYEGEYLNNAVNKLVDDVIAGRTLKKAEEKAL